MRKDTEAFGPATGEPPSIGFEEDASGYGEMKYDGFDRLIWALEGGTQVSYVYRPDGLRHSKTVTDPTSAAASETTTHIWGGSNIVYDKVETKLPGGSVETTGTKYVRGLGLIARQTEAGGDYEHYLMNAHGDVVQIIGENGSGGVVRSYVFDGFGVEEAPDDMDTNPYRYSGQYYDKETGTYYLRARYFAPRLGRFLAEDTHWNPSNNTADIAAIMQSGNLYVYCMNNPVNLSDPTGSYAVADDVAALIVGAIIGAGSVLHKDLMNYSNTGSWEWSSWETYAGASAGGAIGGWATLYVGPVGGVALGSLTGSLIGQGLENITGTKQRTTDEIMNNATADFAMGAFTGLIPGGKNIGSDIVSGVVSGYPTLVVQGGTRYLQDQNSQEQPKANMSGFKPDLSTPCSISAAPNPSGSFNQPSNPYGSFSAPKTTSTKRPFPI